MGGRGNFALVSRDQEFSTIKEAQSQFAKGARIGEKLFIKKICGDSHRRHSGEEILLVYKFIERIVVCSFCGFIMSRRKFWRRSGSRVCDRARAREMVEVKKGCQNPACLKYQQLPEFARPQFDQWVSGGDYRESNLGLRISQFHENWYTSHWLMQDVSKPFPEYLDDLIDALDDSLLTSWALTQEEQNYLQKYGG